MTYSFTFPPPCSPIQTSSRAPHTTRDHPGRLMALHSQRPSQIPFCDDYLRLTPSFPSFVSAMSLKKAFHNAPTAASLIRAARSAPPPRNIGVRDGRTNLKLLHPSSLAAYRFTPASGVFLVIVFKKITLSSALGRPNRPGLSIAESMTTGLLIAPIT
jgi:hypothetical protein